jgi:hypothetical protein
MRIHVANRKQYSLRRRIWPWRRVRMRFRKGLPLNTVEKMIVKARELGIPPLADGSYLMLAHPGWYPVFAAASRGRRRVTLKEVLAVARGEARREAT